MRSRRYGATLLDGPHRYGAPLTPNVPTGVAPVPVNSLTFLAPNTGGIIGDVVRPLGFTPSVGNSILAVVIGDHGTLLGTNVGGAGVAAFTSGFSREGSSQQFPWVGMAWGDVTVAGQNTITIHFHPSVAANFYELYVFEYSNLTGKIVTVANQQFVQTNNNHPLATDLIPGAGDVIFTGFAITGTSDGDNVVSTMTEVLLPATGAAFQSVKQYSNGGFALNPHNDVFYISKITNNNAAVHFNADPTIVAGARNWVGLSCKIS